MTLNTSLTLLTLSGVPNRQEKPAVFKNSIAGFF